MSNALIAGASRGLGLGLARELTGRGWDVTGTTRTDAGSAALAEAGAAAEHLDIDDPASVASLRQRLAGTSFDLLFVNAGVSGPAHRDAAQATPDEIAALFLTNAIAPVRLARALLDLVPDGGVIAFMTSHLGSVAADTDGGMELYRASKAALNSLTRSFTAGLKRELTVLSLHPGWVRTDMGGPGAALDVATSVRGLVDVILARRGSNTAAFLAYDGSELPW